MSDRNGKQDGRTKPSPLLKAPYVLIPLAANLVTALLGFYVALSVIIEEGLVIAHFAILLIFSLILVASAFGIWVRRSIGYAVSIIASVVFLAQEAPRIPLLLGAVTAPVQFYPSLIGFPLVLLSLITSILGFRALRRKRDLQTAGMLAFPTMIALVVVGFIIGGAFVGGLAAATESRLLSSPGGGTGTEITIVQGAGNPNNLQFYSPSTFTVKVGTTVVWVNDDGIGHTVTDNGSRILFDSGVMPTGGVFKFTFTQPGTNNYYCTLHPWMKGTIVVIGA